MFYVTINIKNFKPVFEYVTKHGRFVKKVIGDSGVSDKKNDENNTSILTSPKKFKKWIAGILVTVITAMAGIAWEYWRLKK